MTLHQLQQLRWQSLQWLNCRLPIKRSDIIPSKDKRLVSSPKPPDWLCGSSNLVFIAQWQQVEHETDTSILMLKLIVSALQPPLTHASLTHSKNYTGCCTASWMSVNIHHSNKSLHVTSNCSRVLPVMQLADNSLRCSCVHLYGWWGTNMGTCSSNGHRFHQWAWSRQRSGHHGNDSILVVLERLLLYCCQLWHKSEQLHRYYQPQDSKMLSSPNGDLALLSV